ncbi:MAG: twin-arginine translocase TatA/TatE family subunit [Breznakibacter sp.]|nr:twin-arginine translocase TatA/TatE family subunit [Breznakibacter sp.]
MNTQIFLWSPPGGFEWILIILVVVLLFGGKKIPELMRGLGEGMKEFKKAREDNDKKEDDKKASTNNKDQA